MVAVLWAHRALVVFVFLVLAALGGLMALAVPKTYSAHSSLLIRLGRSYVYQPQIGDAARGATPDTDQVVQSELEILQSDAVKIRVVNDLGLARLYPSLSGIAALDPKRRDALLQGAMRTIGARLKVVSAPDTSIARLSYVDADPQRAALILNTLVDEYLQYRKSVLTDRDLGPLDHQRQVFQKDLDAADAAYQSFLADNGIGDFEAEKTSLSQIYGQLLTDQYSVNVQAGEVQGRLGATAKEMASAQPEIGLYHDLDHTAQDRLAQMRADLQDLLARYQPSAQPVRELQLKIAAQQALVAAGPSPGSGARRVGVNPVFQTLQTEKNQLVAQSASLKDRAARLSTALAEVTAKRQKLEALQPQYDELVRRRDLLSTNLRNLAQVEAEAQAAAALERTGDDGSVKIIERAYPPSRGVSLKAPLLVLALAFAAFSALCAGLAAGFMGKGYPTPDAVERTLDLPVLAVTPSK